MDMRLVLVTHPNKEHAERITRGVIDAKLAACVLVQLGTKRRCQVILQLGL